MLEAGDLGVAVGSIDKELKKVAKLVLPDSCIKISRNIFIDLEKVTRYITNLGYNRCKFDPSREQHQENGNSWYAYYR